MTGNRAAIFADREYLVAAVLLAAVLVLGLATAADYGITTDEFIFNGYGPRALAWYTSGFSDRSLYDHFDVMLYGPWFQILVAIAQSLGLAHPFETRHAVTFVIGLSGIAALLPIGRIAVGRWAGFIAIVLCLTTGQLYGHLFFNPNDVPFLAAMTWTTLAVMIMARGEVPSWGATIMAGVLTGLAIATRFGGILSQAYLAGAMALCVLDLALRTGGGAKAAIFAIAGRTAAALAIGWATTIALWPLLQTANPIEQFKSVYDQQSFLYVDFEFPHWGQIVSSHALPWHYLPGQLLARLPEAFIALLAIALLFGAARLAILIARCVTRWRRLGPAGLLAPMRLLARSRGLMVVIVAALGPPIFIVIKQAVIFDGLRHVLFILPPLALLAAWGLLRLTPLIIRFPVVATAVAAAHLITTVPVMVALHPYEYIAMNSFTGGVSGAYGRFDLDYWSAAATEALRRLEARLQADGSERFATRTPRILICIPWREHMVAPMFRRPWRIEHDPRAADFIIATERYPCGKDAGGALIDEVVRFGQPLAWTLQIPHPGNPHD